MVVLCSAVVVPRLAHAAPLDADVPVDWGPLSLHSRAPVIDNQLSYTQGRIVPLREGAWEISANVSHVNTWAQMPGYFFDGEWTRLAVRAGYGFGAGWEAYVDWALMGRSGGFVDGFIEGFHSTFHVTQARRDQYPRNRLLVQTIDAQGTRTWLSDADAGVGTSNPVLGVRKRLNMPGRGPRGACSGVPDGWERSGVPDGYERSRVPDGYERSGVPDGHDRSSVPDGDCGGVSGAWPALVAELAVRLPAGSLGRAFGSNGFQLLADLALQQPFGGRFVVDVATGLVISPGTRSVYGMEIPSVQKFLMVAFEWRLGRDVMLVLQYLNQDGAVEKAVYAPLNSTTHEFALGVKWAPMGDDAFVLEGGIIENTIHDANTPDFGFSLGGRWRL